MKQLFTIFLSLFLTAQVAWAQPETGGIAPNLTFTDIDGDTYTLYDMLDQGKTVYLDLFATWCGPCWNFHQNHILEDLHTQYGAGGTDEVRVFAIEADPSTAVNRITGQGDRTIGDWTTGISYPIANDHNAARLFNLAAYPTIVVIRPDRVMFNAYSVVYPNIDYLYNTGVGGTNDVIIESRTFGNGSYCDGTTRRLDVSVRNVGATTSDVVVNLLINGEEFAQATATAVEPFKTKRVRFDRYEVTDNVSLEANVVSVNGQPDDKAYWNQSIGSLQSPDLDMTKADQATIIVTTDFYPGDRRVYLEDLEGNVILNHRFRKGLSDQFGGGGVDANKDHEFQVDVSEAGCYRIIISTEELGVGMNYYDPSIHPEPGIQIVDNDGNVVKPKDPADRDFTAARAINFDTKNLTAIEEVQGLADITVFPNPAKDATTLQFMLDRNEDLEIAVLNTVGQQIKIVETGSYVAGLNTVDIPLQNINAGLYYVTVRNQHQATIQRLSVVK